MNAGQGNDFSLFKTTESQESIMNLSRHRDRIEMDMAAMNNRLFASIAEYDNKFDAQGTGADITEIEDRMTRVLLVYSQQQM